MNDFYTEEEKRKIAELERFAKMSEEEQQQYKKEMIDGTLSTYNRIKDNINVKKDLPSEEEILISDEDAEKAREVFNELKKEYSVLRKDYMNLTEEKKCRYWALRQLLNTNYGGFINNFEY